MSKKITPFLWFDKNLKEITDFYISVFPEAKLTSNGTLSDTPSGNVETATLEIFGQELSMMTAGPTFKFTEAISFVISCENQEEVDYYWDKLTAGGEESQCGWLKDRYGLSWQVVPTALQKSLGDSDREKAGRAMQAMLKMKKIIITDLENA
jgi:predicted 3-demethylubiquinone-9 3-methyltransferase (glyoxalase superfamily)